MAFRYAKDGGERVAQDVEELERALRAGEIDPSTPVFDDAVKARLKASAIIAFHKRGAAPTAPAAAPASAPPAAKPLPVKGAAQPPEPERPRARRHAFAAAALAAVAIVVIADRLDVTPYWIGQQTGRALVVTLVAWLVLGWILGKKTEAQKVRLSWITSAVFIAVLAVPTWFAAKWSAERQAADRAALHRVIEVGRRSTAELEASIQESKGAAPSAPSPSPAQPAPTPSPAPEAPSTMLTKAASLIEAMRVEARQEGDAWEAFQSSVGLESTLIPATLISGEERRRHREAFSRYLTESAAHTQRVKALGTRYRAKFVVALGDGPDARAFLEGFDTSMRKSHALLDESDRIEKAFFTEVSGLYDYMTARGEGVGIQGGKLAFASDADANGFNERLARILALSKQLETVQQQQLRDAKAGVQRLEKIESSSR